MIAPPQQCWALGVQSITLATGDLIGRLLAGCLFCILLACPAVLFASVTVDSAVEPSAYYGYLYIGDNTGDISSSELKTINYKGGGPAEWGVGIGRYFTEAVSVEGTFEYWGERYERRGGVVIPGTENNVIQVGGLGLSISALYNFTGNFFHSYLGVGAGYFVTGILVTEPGTGLLGAEDAPSDKLILGYHAVMGFDYRVQGNHKLGVEVKHRVLNADFGQYTNGEIDAGGTYLLFMYRYSLN